VMMKVEPFVDEILLDRCQDESFTSVYLYLSSRAIIFSFAVTGLLSIQNMDKDVSEKKPINNLDHELPQAVARPLASGNWFHRGLQGCLHHSWPIHALLAGLPMQAPAGQLPKQAPGSFAAVAAG
jgi:hypothetical protein